MFSREDESRLQELRRLLRPSPQALSTAPTTAAAAGGPSNASYTTVTIDPTSQIQDHDQLSEELRYLETRYDRFIQEGLANMRAMAASDKNTMSGVYKKRIGGLVSFVTTFEGVWFGRVSSKRLTRAMLVAIATLASLVLTSIGGSLVAALGGHSLVGSTSSIGAPGTIASSNATAAGASSSSVLVSQQQHHNKHLGLLVLVVAHAVEFALGMFGGMLGAPAPPSTVAVSSGNMWPRLSNLFCGPQWAIYLMMLLAFVNGLWTLVLHLSAAAGTPSASGVTEGSPALTPIAVGGNDTTSWTLLILVDLAIVILGWDLITPEPPAAREVA